jgi:Fur family ferric uptake transcriptional regulator
MNMATRSPLKLTKQRQIILEELQKVGSHPSADEVYALVRRRLPRISLATVYRNLEVLAEAGLIQKLALAGSQKRFDGMVENHYHIRCLKCGRVDDVALELLTLGEEVSNFLHGYQCVGHRLEFMGICPHCQEEQADIRPLKPKAN